MTDLEDTFGSDFVQDYKQKIAERRQERQEVTPEAEKAIANKAVNEDGFNGSEPHFQHTTENGVTHDVLLMQLPDPDRKHIFTYVKELDSGAVTCPMDYLGEWMSCLFNDPEDVKSMEPGQHYIVVGNLSQWTNDDGETMDQMSPVRGVITLDEAKEIADGDLAQVSEDPPEQEPEEEEDEEEEDVPSFGGSEDEDEEEEEEDDSDSGGLSFGDDTEDEEDEEEDDLGIGYDEVAEVVNELAEKEPAVWELDDGDERLEQLTQVTATRLDFDPSNEEALGVISDLALERIAEYNEDEEEDDEDDEDALF